MPLPKPKKNESHDDFIDRCMGDSIMTTEYEDTSQRRAVCETQWESEKNDMTDKVADALKKLSQQRGTLTLAGVKPVKVKSEKNWYDIQAKAPNAVEIMIYDEIGAWGITAKQFVEDLKDFKDVQHMNVRINSPGGSVMDGNAIFNAIKNHAARVTVEIDGMALSMGSLIAMAGDHVSMAENALMMIHNPWGGAVGDANEMRKTADVMDKMKQSMVTAYARKSGLTEDTVSDLMDEETWMTAQEALDQGFVDEVSGAVEMAASFDLSKFRNIPEYLLESAIPDINSKRGATMTGKVTTTPAAAAPGNVPDPVDAAAIAEQTLAAEANRRKEITDAFKLCACGDEFRDLMDECLNDVKMTPAEANKKLLRAIGESATSLAGEGRISVGETANMKFRAMASDALAIRAGKKANDPKNELRSYSLLELARESLRISGVSMTGMSKMGIVAAAFTHSTSDFPYLLEDTINKELQRAYSVFPSIWEKIAKRSSVPDFKVNSRIKLGTFNSLTEVKEGGEYTHGTFGDEKETIQAVTKGKMISLTRQAIINDDLDGFMRISSMMGQAAKRTLNADVISVITTNGAMADGTAIFHTDHDNLAGTGAAPTAATVGAGRAAMRKQTAPGTNATEYLDIMPAIFLGPVALEDTMAVLMSSETDFSSSNSKKPNPVRNMAEVVTHPLLDTNSPTAWYLLANPEEVPVVEVAFLDGNDTPYLESKEGWTIDGIEFKVRMDYGTDSIDHRGGYKNAGA